MKGLKKLFLLFSVILTTLSFFGLVNPAKASDRPWHCFDDSWSNSTCSGPAEARTDIGCFSTDQKTETCELDIVGSFSIWCFPESTCGHPTPTPTRTPTPTPTLPPATPTLIPTSTPAPTAGVDDTPPSVTVFALPDPVKDTTISVTGQVNSSDSESGVNCVNVKIHIDWDGSPGFDTTFTNSLAPCAGWSVLLPGTPYPAGRVVKLQGEATDFAGNTGSSSIFSFTVVGSGTPTPGLTATPTLAPPTPTLAPPTPTLAPAPSTSVCPQTGPFSVLCFQASGIGGVIGALVSLLLVLGIIIALFYLLWGALKWINSGGDKALLEGARTQMIGAVTGLIILFLTFLIINILLGFFKIDLGSIVIPRL